MGEDGRSGNPYVTRVFVGGSRRVSRLNDRIRSRLAELVRRDMQVVVGDANGADRAIQRQLAAWHYQKVTVFFVGKNPRNNEGAWPTQRVATDARPRGFEYYAAKDKEMADVARVRLDALGWSKPRYTSERQAPRRRSA